jgi:hypothetical protein
MSIIFSLVGIVVVLGIASTIYVDGDFSSTLENTKIFGYKILDTIEIWRSDFQ